MALFVNGAHQPAHKDRIQQKRQIAYLNEYCSESGVQTLVYEREYVDRHYSEDFWGYYVRCFEGYRKVCSRIHFFAKPFDAKAIKRIFANEGISEKDGVNHLGYRGFMVVKPLPETLIGRTCLSPNGASRQSAEFPTTSRQTANLFGVPLEIQSLPFQEQDHEVAACATSALWSALYGTANIFDHLVLSPLEITRNALARSPFIGRALPNDGLDMAQITGVVRHVGLEADVIDAGRKHLLKGTAYAYLRGGIPLLLSIDFNLKRGQEAELHAVALAGYRFGLPTAVPFPHNGFKLRAARIDSLYAHDDGVGPFAPLDLRAAGNRVTTSWLDDNGNRQLARLDQLLIPLYHQIRIPFRSILYGIVQFDAVLEFLRARHKVPLLPARLEWDIFLNEIGDLKKEILSDPTITPLQKQDTLTMSLPRFVWRAIGSLGQSRKLDLFFDATDLLQGKQLLRSLIYDPDLENSIANGLKQTRISGVREITRRIIQLYGGS